ncbi:MAG: hypothetical protein DRP45_08705 [Candidatus Zixiibacteriota bacterium]|nr:MAG: hypothetical protein DRP45_08705 [candidate division Zixibacteria bacterium]
MTEDVNNEQVGTDGAAVGGAAESDASETRNKTDDTGGSKTPQEGTSTGDGEQAAAKDDNGSGDGDGSEEQSPGEYKFRLPEGVELPEDRSKWLEDFAKESKLSPEQAQNVLDKYLELQGQDMSMAEEFRARQVAENITKIKSFKTFNQGEGFEANIAKAAQGIDRAQEAVNQFFGDDAIDLKDYLETTGIGNDPALVQIAYAYGVSTSEDSFVPSGKGPGMKKQDREDVLYPDDN